MAKAHDDIGVDKPIVSKTAFKQLIWSRYQFALIAVLLLIAVCNYLDRGILAVIQEPIKRDLGLSDWQLGLLGGPAFALFYALSGLPIARLAERTNRASLLAACVGFWSAMTALCGAAQNFVQLAICRFGVGAGEGGCIPISHSLVADRFGVRQRGLVLAVLSSAPSIASVVTPIAGSLIAERYGWRAAFLAVGVPGILVAFVARFVIRDERAEAGGSAKEKSSFFEDLAWLVRNRAFVFVFIAAAFTGMGVYAITLFEMSFLIRSHDLTLAQAGTVKSILGAAGLTGTFLGGLLADRFADDRGRSYVLVPAVGSVLTCVLYFFAFSQSAVMLSLILLVLADMSYNLKNGPVFAAVQNIVPGHMRATGAAVYMIAATVLGSSLGAPLAGAVSDYLAARSFPAELGEFASLCFGGSAVAGSAPKVVSACEIAVAEGLRHSLMIVSFVFAMAALCLFLAAKTIRISTPDHSLPAGRSK